MNALDRTSKKPGYHGQAITEFAIVLPILIALLVGLLEVGRLIYVYSVVSNASRDGARFASAVGLTDDGAHRRYNYCKGIKEAAKRFAYFTPLTITISYDDGPGTGITNTCDGDEDWGVNLSGGDRVVVAVTAHYTPLVKLLPISGRDISTTSARTILGIYDLDNGTSSIPGPVGPVPTNTPTNTPTSTPIPGGPTNTPTQTPTSTPTQGSWLTFTPTPTFDPNAPPPTYTPTLDPNAPTSTPTVVPDTPTPTLTWTPSSTPTITPTATPTFTPTATPTAVPGCGNITTGELNQTRGTPYVILDITNPHDALTVSSVQLIWNAATGGTGNPKTLTWTTATFGGVSWVVNNSSGNFTSTPPASTPVTLSGNNTTTRLTITFDKNYQEPGTAGTTVTVNLATPGCGPITKHK